MALSNDASEPDERTRLLNKDIPKPIDEATSQAVDGSVDGGASKSRVDNEGVVDEEAGEVAADNPLFEGNEEMRKKLYILFPAVAVGVSSLILFCLLLWCLRRGRGRY
jgi:hypothetical protein